MFKIFDGRDNFYQWDLNQKVIVSDPKITEVHFSNKTGANALVCEVYELEGVRVADVPNILLQEDWKLKVYAYNADHTETSDCFKVITRAKPADYVYTETEVRTWEELNKKIEECGSVNLIKEFTGEYPEDEEAVYSAQAIMGLTEMMTEVFEMPAENKIYEIKHNRYNKEYYPTANAVANLVEGIALIDTEEGTHLQLHVPQMEQDITFECESKNLCDIGSTGDFVGSNQFNLGTTLEEGETYTISAVVNSTDTDATTCLILCYMDNTATLSLAMPRSKEGERVSLTFKATKAVNNARFYAANQNANSTGDTASFTDIQIEKGAVATKFTSYVSNGYIGQSLVINNTAHPINNTTGTVTAKSVYPITDVYSSRNGVAEELRIKATYKQDITKAIDDIKAAIISLGGNV